MPDLQTQWEWHEGGNLGSRQSRSAFTWGDRDLPASLSVVKVDNLAVVSKPVLLLLVKALTSQEGNTVPTGPVYPQQ